MQRFISTFLLPVTPGVSLRFNVLARIWVRPPNITVFVDPNLIHPRINKQNVLSGEVMLFFPSKPLVLANQFMEAISRNARVLCFVFSHLLAPSASWLSLG
jgi:hypothetical protein